MQVLQRTLNQIRDQLGRLPVNARLLIGSLMVILVMSLLLVSQYAGRTKMAALGLPNTADVRTKAEQFLRTSNIEYENRGDDLYVPINRQFEVIGQLSEREIVSANQIDFNALIERNANPFIGREQARQNWLTAKMNVLTAMIIARDDVSSARVIIDPPPRTPGIGSAHVSTTATVAVRMNGTPLTQDIADAFGRMVAGAQAGLAVENVTVTDVGSSRSFTPRGGDAMASSTYLERKRQTEDHFRNMIEGQVATIPGAIVAVNAVVKNTRESRRGTTFDDPKIGPNSNESRDFSSTANDRSGEPAVRPNTGAQIGGSGRTTETTESMTRERTTPVFGGENSIIEDSTGYPMEVNALVSLPRSYFVRIYREQQGDDEAEPDTQTLATIVQQRRQELENELAPLIKTGGLADAVAGELRVRMYHDFDSSLMPNGLEMSMVSAPGGLESIGGSASLIKNVGLGALALVSLLMMFLMVRRANVREDLPTPQELVGIPPALEAAESELVGEAEESEPALDGLELGDDTMRTQQLVDQINELVDDDPDEAASLFQRWATIDE